MGPPARTARFEVDLFAVEVEKWNASPRTGGVALYATLEASERPVPEGDADHRVEFFVGLLPEHDDIASPLAALALYCRRERVAVDHGHTVPADGPLWPGTDMRRFIVVRPRRGVIDPLRLPDGTHVEFLQAIPIFESELDLKATNGADGLLDHWESIGVRFWDPGRGPEPG